MPRLYEFEAKRLFRDGGIAVPEGTAVRTPEEALMAAQHLGFPLALKAQVFAGKRAEAGGILFADTPEQAQKSCLTLFSLNIHGNPVHAILLERKVPGRKALYAAVTADPHLRQPVALLSSKGGTGVEQRATEDRLHSLPIDLSAGFSESEAIRLVARLDGLVEAERLPVAETLVKLFTLYRRFDCRLVEINPLALTAGGPVALDARVEIDDDALFRQAALGIKPAEEVGNRAPTRLELAAAKIDEHDHRGTAHFVQVDPDGSYARSLDLVPIGCDCVGTGASLSLMDELVPLGYYPVNFADTSGNPTASKLYRMTRIIFSQTYIRGYAFLSCVSSQQLDNTARGIIKALRELFPSTGGQPDIPFLAVFRGAWDEEAIDLFHRSGINKSPYVIILGRDTTEIAAAGAFDKLYKQWQAARGGKS